MGKIVIINHYGNTPDEPGATRHYELAHYFSENVNKEIHLWICGYNHYLSKNHESIKPTKLSSTKKINNFFLTRFRSTPYKKSNLLRQLNITFFDIVTAVKILFSRNVELIVLSVPPISLFNILAIKIRRLKLIVDIEDLWPLFLIDMGLRNRLAIMYMGKVSKFLYNTADGIDAVSEGMLNYAYERVHDKNKPMWISPLGVNGNIYFNAKDYQKLIEGKSWRNDFIIMYIGALNPANDLYSVLDTIKLFNAKQEVNKKKVSFVFYGDGKELYDLKEYKNKLNLKNVFFEGAVPSSLVHLYLKNSDVCLTNLQKIDSFKLVRPNKLFQYMALSKPIISGIWGESKDIIENEESGVYVDFTNNDKASNKIIKLINDQHSLTQFGLNGRQYIEKHGVREKIYHDYVVKTLEIINQK